MARAARACTTFWYQPRLLPRPIEAGSIIAANCIVMVLAPRRRVTGQVVAQRTECRAPVDAVVTPESVVFAVDHRVDQRLGNRSERNPLEAAHAVVDPHAIDQRAVSIEQIRLRRLPARPHHVEAGHVGDLQPRDHRGD